MPKPVKVFLTHISATMYNPFLDNLTRENPVDLAFNVTGSGVAVKESEFDDCTQYRTPVEFRAQNSTTIGLVATLYDRNIFDGLELSDRQFITDEVNRQGREILQTQLKLLSDCLTRSYILSSKVLL